MAVYQTTNLSNVSLWNNNFIEQQFTGLKVYQINS